MSTLLESVESLKALVTGFATSLANKLTELNTARDSANAAAVAAANAAAAATNPHLKRLVYLNAINGDDSQDGSKTSPVKTWAAMLALAKSGSRLEVFLMTDVIADTIQLWRTPPSCIQFKGTGEDGNGLAQRKVTFVDAVNLAAYSGGLYSMTSMNVETSRVDFEMAHTRSFSPVYVRQGRLEVKAAIGTITRVGTGAALFDVDGSAHFQVSSVFIDPSASGYVVDGIPAGSDPNARPGFTANFDQA